MLNHPLCIKYPVPSHCTKALLRYLVTAIDERRGPIASALQKACEQALYCSKASTEETAAYVHFFYSPLNSGSDVEPVNSTSKLTDKTVISLRIIERHNALGLRLWPASHSMIKLLSELRRRSAKCYKADDVQAELDIPCIRRTNILELGSGVGLVAAFASKCCGLSSFHATDYLLVVLDNLRYNLETLNRCPFLSRNEMCCEQGYSDKVSQKNVLETPDTYVSVSALDWEKSSNEQCHRLSRTGGLGYPLDVFLVSDGLYEQNLSRSLAQTLAQLLTAAASASQVRQQRGQSPQTSGVAFPFALVVAARRNQETLNTFVSAAKSEALQVFEVKLSDDYLSAAMSEAAVYYICVNC